MLITKPKTRTSGRAGRSSSRRGGAAGGASAAGLGQRKRGVPAPPYEGEADGESDGEGGKRQRTELDQEIDRVRRKKEAKQELLRGARAAAEGHNHEMQVGVGSSHKTEFQSLRAQEQSLVLRRDEGFTRVKGKKEVSLSENVRDKIVELDARMRQVRGQGGLGLVRRLSAMR